MEVKHEQSETKGRFYLEEGNQTKAEMTYVWAGEKQIIIDHTTVDESLKGTGAGKKLFDMAVAFANEKGLKVIPLCPFAAAMFRKSPELKHLLS
ncbi:MAG: N-acetyltransferase [Bacteroidia bacterium]|jgi:hypothetical protein|nr:N-acetyltransferase [Bacteroidia bacterium]